MEKYEIEISEPAQRDMVEIYTYISQILKEPISAVNIYQEIKQQILSLNAMPERYGIIQESPYREMGMRKFLVRNYIVFYLTEKATHTVTIIRILYNRREWQNLLGTGFAP